MSDSVDPDEMAHYEPSHLDLCCLQKPIIIACASERVNKHQYNPSFYVMCTITVGQHISPLSQ